MSGNVEIHFTVVLLALVLQLAYDIIAKTRWLPSYFEEGPLVMSKKYPADLASSEHLEVDELQAGFRTAYGNSLAFGQLGQDSFGFRKGLLDIGLYRRIDKGSEGLLRVNAKVGYVEVSLHISWITIGLYAALFVGLLLAALSDLPDSLFSLGSFLLLIQFMDGLFAGAAWLEFKRGSRQMPQLYDEIGNSLSAILSDPARIRKADA